MDLASLAQPQAPQPQAPQGVPGLVQPGAQQRPMPTHAQVVAGLHRFHEIELASGRLLKDPDVGRKNIRPKVLEMGADLIGRRVMSLPEFMTGIKDFPSAEDMLGQKKWLEKLFQSNVQGQVSLLQDHANAPPEGPDAAQWTPDSHSEHMAGLISKYPGK
jgi:hypothetical protein